MHFATGWSGYLTLEVMAQVQFNQFITKQLQQKENKLQLNIPTLK